MADHRPTSPHIQIYRWQYTMLLSILHRAAGIALSLGALVLTAWLLALAAGPQAFAAAQSLVATGVGMVLLFGWSAALFYHLINGLRHLAWDAGWGFSLPAAFTSGIAVIIATIVVTVLCWIVGLAMFGGAA